MKPKTATRVPTEGEIVGLYEQLGLASASDRRRFTQFKPTKSTLEMRTVISTTSNPF